MRVEQWIPNSRTCHLTLESRLKIAASFVAAITAEKAATATAAAGKRDTWLRGGQRGLVSGSRCGGLLQPEDWLMGCARPGSIDSWRAQGSS